MPAVVAVLTVLAAAVVAQGLWIRSIARRTRSSEQPGSDATSPAPPPAVPAWMIVGAAVWVAVVLVLAAMTTYVEPMRICTTSTVATSAGSATERASVEAPPNGSAPTGTASVTSTATDATNETTTACGGLSATQVTLLLLPAVLIFLPALTSLDVLGVKLAFRDVARKVDDQKDAVQRVERDVTAIRQTQTMSVTINQRLMATGQEALEGAAEVADANIPIESLEGS